MTSSGVYLTFIFVAFGIANIPWLNERFLGFRIQTKNGWLRWLEWLLLYGMVGMLSVAVEYKVTGGHYQQEWEFYVTTLCLFMVFALPGFIYHYDLKKYLQKRSVLISDKDQTEKS